MKSKYIFVIGGVMSGVGKGIATSSLGLILKTKGYKVNLVKMVSDPYFDDYVRGIFLTVSELSD